MSGPESDVVHVARVDRTDIGSQAACSCGWKGVDRCRRSDDYAITNAGEEGQRPVMSMRLAGRTKKPIDPDDIGSPHLREDL